MLAPERFTSIRQQFAAVAMIASMGSAAPAHALLFNLTDTGNAQANAGFEAAAGFWETLFIDPIEVNITTGFTALPPGVLGSAGSSYITSSLSDMRTALDNDASSADDATMVAGLPGGNTYSKWINNTSTNPAAHLQTGVPDLRMTRANGKAIGLVTASDVATDAEISFSSLFNWDFDPSDGIDVGAFDFIGVAIHELGHAMGFTSGVDILDINGTARFSDSQFAPFATLLDFTRCSATSQNAGADMDWTVGPAAKDFAIDGNCTALVNNAWSTGVNFGDGRQASHWKDNLGIGIMDPTLASGSVAIVTDRDIQALDVIGWTRQASPQDIPNPGTTLLLLSGLLGLRVARRRARAS